MNEPENLQIVDRDDVTEFESRLGDRMHDSVVDLPPAKGPDVVADRARARILRRRGVLAAAAALALIAGFAGSTLLDDGDEPSLIAGEPTTGQDAGVGPAAGQTVDGDAVTLDWQVTEDGLSTVSSFSWTDAGLYAISTAPGTRWQDYPDGNVPRAMYRFGEDGSWAAIELTDDDPAISRISERGGSLYALGTGASTGQPIGSVSTDGGESWASVPLDATDPPSDDLDWGLSYYLDLASTNEVTLALVTANFYLPAEELFPELLVDPGAESDPAAEYSWEYTDDGVSLVRHALDGRLATAAGILDESIPEAEWALREGLADSETGEREVVRTVPWSDLGLTGAADLAPQVSAYLVDGDDWTAADSPVQASADGWTTLTAVGDSMLMSNVVYSEDSPEGISTLLRSADGVSWTQVAAPGPGTTLASPAGLIHSAYAPSGETIVSASSDQGTTWYEVDLASLDPRIAELGGTFSEVFAGPLGVAILVNEATETGAGAAYLAYSSDLVSWTVADLREVSPESNWFDGVLVGTDRIVVRGVGDARGAGEPQETHTLIAIPRS